MTEPDKMIEAARGDAMKITDEQIEAGARLMPTQCWNQESARSKARAIYLAMKALDPEIANMREALREARPYVEAYCQEHGGTGTLLQTKLVALLAKIDAALSPMEEIQNK